MSDPLRFFTLAIVLGVILYVSQFIIGIVGGP